jgi:hypothetical protein
MPEVLATKRPAHPKMMRIAIFSGPNRKISGATRTDCSIAIEAQARLKRPSPPARPQPFPV